MKKKLSKKIITSLLISMAGLFFAAFAVYAAGVVFFGGGSAQTTVTFQTVGTRTWTVPEGVTTVEVLTVAGGGGGGMDMGGGGGGGGVIYNADYPVTPGSNITVTIGAGGNGAPAANTGGQPGGHQYTISATNGQNSVFGTITAIGGGYGGSSYYGYTPNYGLGNSGGSGGGSSGYTATATTIGASGTAGQGFKGGNAGGADYASGGGGGAGGPGANGPNQANGGPGILYSSISSYYFGGGGGGAAYSLATGGNGGIGGGGGGAVGTTYGGAGLNNGAPGGGGVPNYQTNKPGGNAGANTGGGGGGGSHYNATNKGGNGGSGIVVIRYGKSKMAASSIEKGLVGYWALDGDGYNASTGRVTDKTPYEHHGTNNGATLTTDQKGQTNGAMSFGGSNYVDAGANSSLNLGTGSASIGVWFRTTATSGALVTKRTGSGFQVYVLSNKFYVDGGGTNGVFSPDNRSVSNDGNWHHGVAVYDRGSSLLKLYVDGVFVASTALGATSLADAGNLNIGRKLLNGVGDYFNGSISDVRIYNRALSATEVTTLYGAYKPKVMAGSLQQGLVLDMPLTSNYTKTVTAGSQIMTDRTPYSSNGQNYGGTVSSEGTSFNGSQYIGNIDTNNPALFEPAAITVSSWINMDTDASTARHIWFTKWLGFSSEIEATTRIPYFRLNGLGDVRSNTPITLGEWHHFVGTYDPAIGGRVYLDGVSVGAIGASGAMSYSRDYPLNIGRYYGGIYFKGKISNAKIYNRALSPQEIESLYVQGATNLGGIKTHPASCKVILDAGESTGDGFYTIKPSSGGLSFRAYCDMTTDGGGWTLVNSYLVDSINIKNATVTTSYDSNGGAIITSTATSPGCSEADSGTTVRIKNDIHWTKIRHTGEYYDVASCFSMNGAETFGGTGGQGNLIPFDSSLDVMRNCYLTCEQAQFSNFTSRCDNEAGNFMRVNGGQWRRFETILRRNNSSVLSGIAVGVSCNSLTTKWRSSNIYVK